MAITIHIYYQGSNGNAEKFAREMVERGIVDRIRAEAGNLGYAYFFPMEEAETVLLIDRWEDQTALDLHHASPMMAEIAQLRERYGLRMRVERYVTDEAGIPPKDRAFLKN